MGIRKKATRVKAARKKAPRRKKTTAKKSSKRKTRAKKATRKKTTRKKAPRKKATTRKTTKKKPAAKKATARKTAKKKPARRKVAKKIARKKVRRKAAKKTTRAQPTRRKTPLENKKKGKAAATPTPGPVLPPSIAAKLPKRIGRISHYFGQVHAAAVAIEAGELRRGDTIHVRGHTTDFYQRVERMERDHTEVETARVGQQVGVEVSQRVREGDDVIRVSG